MNRKYIAGQEKHPRKISVQDQLRIFLRKCNIEYDERFVWK